MSNDFQNLFSDMFSLFVNDILFAKIRKSWTFLKPCFLFLQDSQILFSRYSLDFSNLCNPISSQHFFALEPSFPVTSPLFFPPARWNAENGKRSGKPNAPSWRKLKPQIVWIWVVGFKYFLFSALFGEMIQFDEHIFQMGWNHQLGIFGEFERFERKTYEKIIPSTRRRVLCCL